MTTTQQTFVIVGLPADIPRWSAVRDRIYNQIMERGWHPARQVSNSATSPKPSRTWR